MEDIKLWVGPSPEKLPVNLPQHPVPDYQHLLFLVVFLPAPEYIRNYLQSSSRTILSDMS